MIRSCYRNVSPSAVLRAISSEDAALPDAFAEDPSLAESLKNATDKEKAFGRKVADSARLLRDWCKELDGWDWTGTFETSYPEKESPGGHAGGGWFSRSPVNGIGSNGHTTSNPSACLPDYENRIGAIAEELEALDMEQQKSLVLHAHLQHPDGSPKSPGHERAYQDRAHLDGLTALITATILNSLPHYARLQYLLDIWTARVVVLRTSPGFLKDLETAKADFEAAWEAVDQSQDGSLTLKRDTFEQARTMMGVQLGGLGRRLDIMLDALEGRKDTIPDEWIDEVEGLEENFTDWIVAAQNEVSRMEGLTLTTDQSSKAVLAHPGDAGSQSEITNSGEAEVLRSVGLPSQAIAEHTPAETSFGSAVSIVKDWAYIAARPASITEPQVNSTTAIEREPSIYPAVPEHLTPSTSPSALEATSIHQVSSLAIPVHSKPPPLTSPTQSSPSKPGTTPSSEVLPPGELKLAASTSEGHSVVSDNVSDANMTNIVTAQAAGEVLPLAISDAREVTPVRAIDHEKLESRTTDPESDSELTPTQETFPATISQDERSSTAADSSFDLSSDRESASAPSVGGASITSIHGASTSIPTRRPLELHRRNSSHEIIVNKASLAEGHSMAEVRTVDINKPAVTQRRRRSSDGRFAGGQPLQKAYHRANKSESSSAWSARNVAGSLPDAVPAVEKASSFNLAPHPASIAPLALSREIASEDKHVKSLTDEPIISASTGVATGLLNLASSQQEDFLASGKPAAYDTTRDTRNAEKPISPHNDDAVIEYPPATKTVPLELPVSPDSPITQSEARPITPERPLPSVDDSMTRPVETTEIDSSKELAVHDSPRTDAFFSDDKPQTPRTPVNILRLETPFSGSDDQLDRQIDSILQSLPTRIDFRRKTRKSSVQPSYAASSQSRSLSSGTPAAKYPERSQTPGLTLARADNQSEVRAAKSSRESSIRLYHLMQTGKKAPIKLYVRLVGEGGERVMVRIGGGWADLAQYLQEYASHHSKAIVPDPSQTLSTLEYESPGNNRAFSLPAHVEGRKVSGSGSNVHGTTPPSGTNSLAASRLGMVPSDSATLHMSKQRSLASGTLRSASAQPLTEPSPLNTPKADESSDEEDSPVLGTLAKLSEEKRKWLDDMVAKAKQHQAEKGMREGNAAAGVVGKTKRVYRTSDGSIRALEK